MGGSAWERDEKPEAAVPGAFPESADIPQRGSGIASGPAAVVTVRRGTAPSTLDSSGRRSPARPTIRRGRASIDLTSITPGAVT